MDKEIKRKIEEILDEKSLDPEMERKPREQREKELIFWYEAYQEVNTNYNLYGMDLKSSVPIKEWLDGKVFRKQRHDINAFFYPQNSSYPYDYTIFMRDKWSFEMLMRSIFGKQKKYWRSKGILMNGVLYSIEEDGGTKKADISSFFDAYNNKKLVFKNTFGSGGKYVRILEIKNNCINAVGEQWSYDDYLQHLYEPKTNWLIQDYIIQHPFMASLNESSVNTLRFITYNTGRRVVVSDIIFLLYGKKGELTDNTSNGGSYLRVDRNGKMDRYVFDENGRHIFNRDDTVPFMHEAIELVTEAHRHIPQLFTIGWDVVLTDEGPIILEGNDGWDTEDYPERSNWNILVAERKEFSGK